MQFSIAIFASVLAAVATASPVSSPLIEAVNAHKSRQIAPNTIDTFSDGSCGSYVTTLGTPTTGACFEIAQAGSVRTTNVQAGCSITVYSDSVCSDNAAIAGLGACLSGLSNGATINSYSVNC